MDGCKKDLNNALKNTVWFLSCPVWRQELNSVILVGLFEREIFYDFISGSADYSCCFWCSYIFIIHTLNLVWTPGLNITSACTWLKSELPLTGCYACKRSELHWDAHLEQDLFYFFWRHSSSESQNSPAEQSSVHEAGAAREFALKLHCWFKEKCIFDQVFFCLLWKRLENVLALITEYSQVMYYFWWQH